MPEAANAVVHQGWLSLIPAFAAITFALLFRRTFEALLGASVLGFILLHVLGLLEVDFFTGFVQNLQKVMADPVIVWIMLVVGLFGGLIALLVKSGGALAFGEVVSGLVKGRRGALVVAWCLGIIIFIDDYLNALVVGSAMRRVTDKFRVSREMLAYVVDSTAAPVCVIIPFSTWALFTAGLLADNGVAAAGEGLSLYMTAIPYMLYPFITLAMVLLFALGILPEFGPMRAAEERARAGQPIPPGSENVTLLDREHESVVPAERARLLNFLLPIGVLIVASWFPGTDIANGVWIGEIDAIKGVLAAIVVTSFLFLFQRLTSPTEFSEVFFSGVRSMVYPLAIVVMSFVLVEVNNKLGLTTFVIEGLRPLMHGGLFPAVVFTACAAICFMTGSYWGTFAIALPIVLPMAKELDSSIPLAIGAVVSAGAFGSHLCPFGDATVLSSAASGCNNLAHVRTQMPYGLIAGGLALVGYIVLGMM